MPPLRIPLLVLATGNRHKALELESLLAPLSVPLRSLADFPAAQSIAETGATLRENCRLKAAGYARQLGQWVLSDDTGLEVDALHGAPGVHTARYAGPLATMAENRAKLLKDLDRFDGAERAGRFVCHLAIASPDGAIVAETCGTCEGRLRREPAGAGGFGYDVLFEVEGLARTLAELSPAEVARAGHRGRAIRRLTAMLSPTCAEHGRNDGMGFTELLPS